MRIRADPDPQPNIYLINGTRYYLLVPGIYIVFSGLFRPNFFEKSTEVSLFIFFLGKKKLSSKSIRHQFAQEIKFIRADKKHFKNCTQDKLFKIYAGFSFLDGGRELLNNFCIFGTPQWLQPIDNIIQCFLMKSPL